MTFAFTIAMRMLPIKRLHLYMIKSYIGPFIFTFLIAVFVLLMQFLWKYIDEFVGKGIAWNIMAETIFLCVYKFYSNGIAVGYFTFFYHDIW
jgi:hypothetical protein